jgi:UPF0271 protein
MRRTTSVAPVRGWKTLGSGAVSVGAVDGVGTALALGVGAADAHADEQAAASATTRKDAQGHRTDMCSSPLQARSDAPPRGARYSIAAVRIDLNADVGESYGAWHMGQDEALIPLVTSVNIACGAHAGDPLVMAQTVSLACRNGVQIGAHPGYPDRDGFGRREISLSSDELEASLLFQLGALAAFVHEAGAELRHVKPHGALYNTAAKDVAVAAGVARAVKRFDPSLLLVGLCGSALLEAGREAGLAVAAEAFADRVYEPDGSLRSRRYPDAVLPDPEAAAEQAVSIVVLGKVTAHDGTSVPIQADTLCIHGDTPGAPEYARVVRDELAAAGVSVEPLPASPVARRGRG